MAINAAPRLYKSGAYKGQFRSQETHTWLLYFPCSISFPVTGGPCSSWPMKDHLTGLH